MLVRSVTAASPFVGIAEHERPRMFTASPNFFRRVGPPAIEHASLPRHRPRISTFTDLASRPRDAGVICVSCLNRPCAGIVRLFEAVRVQKWSIDATSFTRRCVAVNLHFWQRPVSGVYNVGTGVLKVLMMLRSRSSISTRRGGDHRLSLSSSYNAIDEHTDAAQLAKISLYPGRATQLRSLILSEIQRSSVARSYVEWLLAPVARITCGAAAFLDRDGVINIDRGYVIGLRISIRAGVFELRQLQGMGFAL